MAKEYILKEGSLHETFANSRARIQFFGGGFGNGKTSAMVIKALQLAMDYPGSNGLMARSTYPKLNDTLRKTFLEFCPSEWIASFPTSKNSDNTCTLTNGSTINFRYIQQRKGTDDGGSTSNLLSATYDWMVVDQLEDPEIIHKDFLDLMGRLRGDTVYRGDDPTMPRRGPRWFLVSANPTRNWVYKKLIKPYHDYINQGIISDDLLVVRKEGQPVLDADGKPRLLIDVVEGSTYTNQHILPADFIEGLESTYTGQMRERYLMGEWSAYEGLVYPDFQESVHVIRHDRMELYLRDLLYTNRAKLVWLDAYDYGISAPSCYLLAFTDHLSNVFVLDGFYKPEAKIEWQCDAIRNLRSHYGADITFTLADPQTLRRGSGDTRVVGRTVADLFHEVDSSINFERGNNDIINGITKVQSYLQPRASHIHPIYETPNAPYLYFSSKLQFILDEFGGYFWKSNTSGEISDEPNDKNDHAMDALKYLLSERPEVALIKPPVNTLPPFLTMWQEVDTPDTTRSYRH